MKFALIKQVSCSGKVVPRMIVKYVRRVVVIDDFVSSLNTPQFDHELLRVVDYGELEEISSKPYFRELQLSLMAKESLCGDLLAEMATQMTEIAFAAGHLTGMARDISDSTKTF